MNLLFLVLPLFLQSQPSPPFSCYFATYQVMEWNEDGTSALVRVQHSDMSAPELPAGYADHIFNFQGKKKVVYIRLTQNFASKEGAYNVERARDQCAYDLKAANKELEKRGFQVRYPTDRTTCDTPKDITLDGKKSGPHPVVKKGFGKELADYLNLSATAPIAFSKNKKDIILTEKNYLSCTNSCTRILKAENDYKILGHCEPDSMIKRKSSL